MYFYLFLSDEQKESCKCDYSSCVKVGPKVRQTDIVDLSDDSSAASELLPEDDSAVVEDTIAALCSRTDASPNPNESWPEDFPSDVSSAQSSGSTVVFGVEPVPPAPPAPPVLPEPRKGIRKHWDPLGQRKKKKTKPLLKVTFESDLSDESSEALVDDLMEFFCLAREEQEGERDYSEETTNVCVQEVARFRMSLPQHFDDQDLGVEVNRQPHFSSGGLRDDKQWYVLFWNESETFAPEYKLEKIASCSTSLEVRVVHEGGCDFIGMFTPEVVGK